MNDKPTRKRFIYFFAIPATLILIVILLIVLLTDDKNVSPFLYITR